MPKKGFRSAFTHAGYRQFNIVRNQTTQKLKRSWVAKLLRREKKREYLSDYIIMAGPLRANQKLVHPLLPNASANSLTPDTIKHVEEHWTPQPALTVFDHKTKKPLTASEASDKLADNNRWMPQYFQNPMQSYDYLVYESLLKNTLLGPLSWSLVRFIMGTGFKPVLKLKEPTNDKKKDAALIKKHEFIINNLMYVDRCTSEKSDEEGIDISFESKITNLIYNMLVFNRSCLVYKFNPDAPIKLDPTGGTDKKAYPDLPTSLIDFHPRDIGISKISPETNKMVAVQISQISGLVKMERAIYLWNSQYGAPIHNAKYYGGSILMPMVEPARLIRSQVSSILPSISENMAGGLYHIFVKPEGGTHEQRMREYESMTTTAEYGTASVMMIDPARVKYENVNFDPKISELIELFSTQIKYIIMCFNLPQFASYDEAAANHATAVERIQLTISTVINPMRKWIGGDFSKQWYDRNFRIIYKDDKKLLEMFEVGVEFEDLQVETLKERVESLETLADIGLNLDNEKKEELLQIEGLGDHLVEDNINDPGNAGIPKEKFKVKADGKKYKVKTD